jgi:hypothetical protein
LIDAANKLLNKAEQLSNINELKLELEKIIKKYIEKYMAGEN